MIDAREFPSSKIIELGDNSGYFPVVATTNGSDVVIIYRAGAGHVGRSGRLECLRSEDKGETWSEPSMVADSDRDDRNPAIGVTQSGIIVVGYHVNGCYDENGRYDRSIRDFDTFFTRSHDRGRTWETPYRLNYESLNERSPYGQMLTLDDGTLLMPIYGEKTGKLAGEEAAKGGEWGFSYLLRSRDEGKSWGDPSVVAADMNEAAFLLLLNGEMLASLRGEEDGSLHLCRSEDGGRSWTKPERFEGGERHPSCLTLLSNGCILMCYGYRAEPYGARAAISRDGGRSWEKENEIILGDQAPTRDCGYPSTVRLNDDTLVTAFYSVGPHGKSDSAEGARCNVVFYSEAELLGAFRVEKF